MDFDEECDEFIRMHRAMRTGARLQRISLGLGHSERTFLKNVWWPMFHHFENLHPEYEVRDYADGYRYIDFAYIQPHFRVAIEIDGFGPHWRNISKWQFTEHNNRQNSLIIDGWYVLRFAYADVEDRCRFCQQTIQQLMGRWQNNPATLPLTASEREIVRLTIQSLQPITPKDVCELLHVCPKSGQKLLHGLMQGRWLQPASGHVRITGYSLHPSKMNIRL